MRRSRSGMSRTVASRLDGHEYNWHSASANPFWPTIRSVSGASPPYTTLDSGNLIFILTLSKCQPVEFVAYRFWELCFMTPAKSSSRSSPFVLCPNVLSADRQRLVTFCATFAKKILKHVCTKTVSNHMWDITTNEIVCEVFTLLLIPRKLCRECCCSCESIWVDI